MVQTRIQPLHRQQAERARRAGQQRLFRRNQMAGLLLLAALICLWTLLRTHSSWIFPTSWWRL